MILALGGLLAVGIIAWFMGVRVGRKVKDPWRHVSGSPIAANVPAYRITQPGDPARHRLQHKSVLRYPRKSA